MEKTLKILENIINVSWPMLLVMSAAMIYLIIDAIKEKRKNKK